MNHGWQPARPVPGFDRCFVPYVRWLLRRSFEHVWLRCDAASFPSGGFIAAANHRSWWDGFIPYYLHRSRYPDQPFAIMMSARELRKFPFFRLGGAFSVDASSARRARQAVKHAADLAAGGAAVWIFPQGEWGADASWLPFTSGFVHAARWAGVPVVPVAMRFTMRRARRPEAFIDVAPARGARERGARCEIEEEVRLRAAGIDRDIACGMVESSYDSLLSGHAGVDARLSAAAGLFARWVR